jgi:hypothetical protein
MPERMNIISPTGHLGFTPIERGSFEIGLTHRLDAIVADSGSCDIGPQPLGADEHCSPEAWQRHDLELMLLAARRLGVPMIVGSASDTGAACTSTRRSSASSRATTGSPPSTWRRSSRR